MNCHLCGKEGARIELVTETAGKGNDIMLIENVPLIVCPNCGESYYTARTLHEMENIHQSRRGVQPRLVSVAEFT
ncbi:MAG: YgiT-type zinc finger protein [Calditrichaeota bacterium]|nr:YgiT-type zinc finger protein [Calditrichota bacterium]